MKARPILFSAPMVRALLDDRKTQTRRIVKPQPHFYREETGFPVGDGRRTSVALQKTHTTPEDLPNLCPYGVPGGLLYVRETWASDGLGGVRYYATDVVHELRRKRVSIHMPRRASRLTLEITDVRVERLQDISEADAKAEGIIEFEPTEIDPAEFAYEQGGDLWNNAVSAYAALWRKINGPDSWVANPWVWAVSFKVHRANVDQVLANREGGGS